MCENSIAYDRYIRHLTEIRSLSSPSLDGISNAEGYSTKLRENFTRIGMLASDNRAFLDETLFPLLRSGSELSETEAGDMDVFTERLLNAEELWDLWHEDPERYGQFDSERFLKFLLTRNRCLAGRISELPQHLPPAQERARPDGCINNHVGATPWGRPCE